MWSDQYRKSRHNTVRYNRQWYQVLTLTVTYTQTQMTHRHQENHVRSEVACSVAIIDKGDSPATHTAPLTCGTIKKGSWTIIKLPKINKKHTCSHSRGSMSWRTTEHLLSTPLLARANETCAQDWICACVMRPHCVRARASYNGAGKCCLHLPRTVTHVSNFQDSHKFDRYLVQQLVSNNYSSCSLYWIRHSV